MPVSGINVRIGADLTELRKKMFQAERTLQRSGRRLAQLGNELSSTFTVALGGLAIGAVKAAGDIEALEKAVESAFQGKLGDAQIAAKAARTEIELLRKEALKPGLSFEQALQGSVRLQSVGFSANQARETLATFGNALALVGGRATDLDGVTLALTQIISKGKISAEEINQLAERVPQIRQAIQAGFGTSDSEELQKLGIGVQEFVSTTTAELAKLPEASGGIRNSIENAAQATKQFLADIGKEINASLNLEENSRKFAEALKQVSDTFKSFPDGVKKAIVQFSLFVALIGPAIKILGVYKLTKASLFNVFRGFVVGIGTTTVALRANIAASTASTKAGRLLNGTMKTLNATLRANPIGLVVTAIEILIAGFAIAYARSERFRAAISGLGAVAKEVFMIVKESVSAFVGGFNRILEGDVIGGLKDMGGALVKANPVSIALTQGKRLAGAFSKGYKEGLNKEIEESTVDLTGDLQKALNATNFSAPTNNDSESSGQQRQTFVIEALDRVTPVVQQIQSLTAQAFQPKKIEFEVDPNALVQLGQAFDLIDAKAMVFGDSFDMVGEKIRAIQSTINELLESGFSPFSTEVEFLTEKLAGLTAQQEASQKAQQALAESTKAAQNAFTTAAQAQITSIRQLGSAILAETAKAVKARIQQAVATQVLKAVETVPFPFNIAIAAAAGAGISALFSKAISAVGIPALAEGGLAFGPTLAVVGDNPGASSNPEVIAPLDKLQNFFAGNSDMQIRGELRASGDELVAVIERAMDRRTRTRGF